MRRHVFYNKSVRVPPQQSLSILQITWRHSNFQSHCYVRLKPQSNSFLKAGFCKSTVSRRDSRGA